MFTLCCVLVLFASASSESVRETETWMPMKTTQTVGMSTRRDDLISSGDSPNGSDFGFTDDDELFDDEDDDEDEESSGSGGGAIIVTTRKEYTKPSDKPDVNDNKIPEVDRPAKPTDDVEIIQTNEIHPVRKEAPPSEEKPSNVLMSHASEESVFNKTEVLAALIAGGAVGLMFAVLLILLLIYRMKKKDEGSYDLGKKPIYKKAPTTEIYA
ncbi:syndecan-4 isoform 2-T2 [Polymixia lowei]